MTFWSIILMACGILSILYALPYASYEWKQKNKAGAIVIYTIALCLFIISIIQIF